GTERLADGEADEAGPSVFARNEQQDAEHQDQLDTDQQHADAHAGLQRNRVNRVGLALQAGKRRARVGVGVDADTEPSDAVATADTDQAESQDHQHARGAHLLQHAEVQHHDGADQHLQHQDEFALLEQVRLAGLPDDLRDVGHRLVNRQRLDLLERYD